MKTALEILFARSRGRVSKSNFGETDSLLKFLKHPEENFPAIHIAGTNGKGSCAHKLAIGYAEEGYKVGLFTSPHIFEYNERIKINGKVLPYDKLLPLLTILLEKFPNATFFEITTALAFYFFAQEKVDLAIVETGLGGKFDSTNRVHPCCTLITSIGLEHQDILGETVEEIAEAKLGILKEGVPFVIGPTVPTTLPKIEGAFKTFDEENCALVEQVFKLMNKKFPVSKESLKVALLAVAPLRLQKICDGLSTYYIDVAHNPPALRRSFEALEKKLILTDLQVLFALAPGKDTASCEKIIPSECTRISELKDFKSGTLLIIGSFQHISEVLKISHLKKTVCI